MYLTDWLTDWPTNQPTDRLPNCLTDWLMNWLAYWGTGWLAGWLAKAGVSSIDWLAGWLISDWLALISHSLFDWLAGWLTDWVTFGWLAGWLIFDSQPRRLYYPLTLIFSTSCLKGEGISNEQPDGDLGKDNILTLADHPSLTPGLFEQKWKSLPQRWNYPESCLILNWWIAFRNLLLELSCERVFGYDVKDCAFYIVTVHTFCTSQVWSKIFRFLKEFATNTKVFVYFSKGYKNPKRKLRGNHAFSRDNLA